MARAGLGERLAERARKLSDNTFWVLSVSLLTRGTDLGGSWAPRWR